MIVFIHAAPVSLAATEAALRHRANAPPVRHALLPGLVDPKAATFEPDEAAFAKLHGAIASELDAGVTRVILSCSVFNGFAPRLESELGVPVERSDDAGTWAALGCGARVGLAVSYAPSFPVVEAHIRAVAASLARDVTVAPLLSENAFEYADDTERYGAALADAARRAANVDCVFLAQFSMDPFAGHAAAGTEAPVISALEACLLRLAP
jgi:hypothetical protein